MSSNQFIEDNLTRHQIFVQRYISGAAKEVNKGLKDLSKEITKQMNLKDETLHSMDLVRLRDNINQMIVDSDIIIEKAEEYARYEIGYFEKLLDKSTSADLIMRVSPETIYATVSQIPMRLTSTSGKVTVGTIDQLIDNFTKTVPKNVISRLQAGISEGESVKTIARDIERIVGTRKRREAEALTRTIINHVGTEARNISVSVNQDIIENEEYVATLDKDTTILCAGYDGKLFDIGKGPYPPLHWN